MKPQFKDLKFETEKQFKLWLAKTAIMKIEFVDTGNDLTTIWINNKGEILHANLQTSIWCGRFVSLIPLQKGKPIQMYFENGGWKTMHGLVIASKEKIKQKHI